MASAAPAADYRPAQNRAKSTLRCGLGQSVGPLFTGRREDEGTMEGGREAAKHAPSIVGTGRMPTMLGFQYPRGTGCMPRVLGTQFTEGDWLHT